MAKRARMCPELFPDLLECSASSLAPPSSPPAASSGDVDRLSDLPDVLRLHILSLLPLKAAIRTGVLSSRWRGIWAYRWPDPSSLYLSSQSTSTSSLPFATASAAAREEDDFVSSTNRRLEKRGHRRIDSMVLSFHQGQVPHSTLKNWLDYAAACSVEDFHLHIFPPEPSSATLLRRNNINRRKNNGPSFQFPMENPLLSRLSLRGVHITAAPSGTTRLEILALHSVSLTDAGLRKVVAACPVLRCLDIRCCKELRRIQISASGPHLRSLTIVDCPKASELVVSSARGLRSFRFCGNFIKYSIENDNAYGLEDVYFTSAPPNLSLPISNWVNFFERLANVTVLTLCSLALQYIAVRGAGKIGPMRSLYRLKELQLMMLIMSDSSLNDLFAFLKLYQCPVLEQLFIELPTSLFDQHSENHMEIVEEEPPREDLGKLKTIKIKNYKGHYNEIRLVQYLLAKATNLISLTVIAPRETLDSEYLKEPSKQLQFLHKQLSLFHKASKNAEIYFFECDIDALQPTHSEPFFKI